MRPPAHHAENAKARAPRTEASEADGRPGEHPPYEWGCAVEVLDLGKEKEVSGVEVRQLMRSGLPWEHLVPDGTAGIVRRALASPI
jgi:hypothetical protein